MAHVIAIANEKGGTGKTTSALNISAHLAAQGNTVLLVDVDPQANATHALGFAAEAVPLSLYHALLGEMDVLSLIRRTDIASLDLLPASKDLAGATVELLDMEERETRLRELLEPLKEVYDVIVLDCPPSLGILTVNALAAADWVLVPADASLFAVEGVRQLMRTLELIRENLAIEVELAGIIRTMHDRRSRLTRRVERELKAFFREHVWDTTIPKSTDIAEATMVKKSVFAHAPRSKGAAAYRMLGEELAEKLFREDAERNML